MSTPTSQITTSVDLENSHHNQHDYDGDQAMQITTVIDIALIALVFAVIFLSIYCLFSIYIRNKKTPNDSDSAININPQISVAVMSDNKIYSQSNSIEEQIHKPQTVHVAKDVSMLVVNPYVHTQQISANSTVINDNQTMYDRQITADSTIDNNIHATTKYHHSSQISAQSTVLSSIAGTMTASDTKSQISAQSTVLNGTETTHHQKTYSGVSVVSNNTASSNRSEGRVKVNDYNIKGFGEGNFILYENEETTFDNPLDLLPNATPMETHGNCKDMESNIAEGKLDCIALPMPSTISNYHDKKVQMNQKREKRRYIQHITL